MKKADMKVGGEYAKRVSPYSSHGPDKLIYKGVFPRAQDGCTQCIFHVFFVDGEFEDDGKPKEIKVTQYHLREIQPYDLAAKTWEDNQAAVKAKNEAKAEFDGKSDTLINLLASKGVMDCERLNIWSENRRGVFIPADAIEILTKLLEG